MAKYTPSYLDVSGFNKALNDQLNRNAQINLRREQILDSNIDQYLKSYTGKVRTQDQNKHNNLFNEWAGLKRAEMGLRRKGGPQLSKVSMAANMAKRKLEIFSDESRQLGELQKYLSSIKNDVLDIDKYQGVVGDLFIMDVDEAKQKYNGIENIPRVFEISDDYNVGSLNRDIKTASFGKKLAPITMPSMKDGIQETKPIEFKALDINGKVVSKVLDVPMKMTVLDMNPLQYRNWVESASLANNKHKGYLKKVKKDVLAKLSNPEDAVAFKDANDTVLFAQKAFGKSSAQELTGEDLYTAKIVMSGSTEPLYEPDYEALSRNYEVLRKAMGLKSDQIKLTELQKSVAENKKNSKLSKISQILGAYSKAVELGIYDENIIDLLNDEAAEIGYKRKFDKSTIDAAIQGRIDILKIIADNLTKN